MPPPKSATPREARALELGARAQALRRAGRSAEAVSGLREAVRLAPRHAGLRGNLGNALLAIGRRAEGLAALERACALDPGSGTLAYNLGTALLGEARHAEARAALERALALGELPARVHVNLGRLDEIEGRLESAAEHWRRAAELAPRLARPHLLLARVGRLVDRRPLEVLVAAADTPAAERAEAHFGLGHVFDREDEPARAFEHFAAGNRLRKAALPRFDPAGHEAEVERLVRAFDADFLARLEPASASDAPLFLVGLPRSGTTLAESILGAHPDVRACGERTEIDALARTWRARGFPGTSLPRAERERAARDYLAALDPTGAARRLTDKMPGNTMHLGVIAALFARARVVHCRRDPLDTALSLFFQLFEGDSVLYGTDLEHIARVIRAQERLMRHWAEHLPLARFALDYEALVADVEAHSRALVAFAGLEWDPACLTREGNGPVRTASAWRVRARVDGSSVGRWRRYATQLAPVRALLDAA